ncbi:conserved hypothetical protein [Desulfovibrionales bacterium]
MSEPISPQKIMDFLRPRLGIRFKTWLSICTHCGLCADTCHFYLAHNRIPAMIPAYKVTFLQDLITKKGHVNATFMQQMYDVIYHECNMCRRCTMYCPFGIDIALLINLSRALLFHLDIAPEGLMKAIQNYHESGNQMAVTDIDWVDTVEWCAEECQDELKDIKIPIDKVEMDYLYTINAREAKFYPQDIQEVAKIFHVAGESWTLPSAKGWDDTNLSMFCGDTATSRMIVENTFKRAEELRVKKVAVTE